MDDETISVIDMIANGTKELAEETEDLNTLLLLWAEAHNGFKKFNRIKETIEKKLKVHLKKRGWKRYVDDESKISVALTSRRDDSIDKNTLKLMLNEGQMAQITRIRTYDEVSVVTPETRERLKKIVKKQKPGK